MLLECWLFYSCYLRWGNSWNAMLFCGCLFIVHNSCGCICFFLLGIDVWSCCVSRGCSNSINCCSVGMEMFSWNFIESVLGCVNCWNTLFIGGCVSIHISNWFLKSWWCVSMGCGNAVISWGCCIFSSNSNLKCSSGLLMFSNHTIIWCSESGCVFMGTKASRYGWVCYWWSWDIWRGHIWWCYYIVIFCEVLFRGWFSFILLRASTSTSFFLACVLTASIFTTASEKVMRKN